MVLTPGSFNFVRVQDSGSRVRCSISVHLNSVQPSECQKRVNISSILHATFSKIAELYGDDREVRYGWIRHLLVGSEDPEFRCTVHSTHVHIRFGAMYVPAP